MIIMKHRKIKEKWIYLDGVKSRYTIRDNGIVWNNDTNSPMAGGRDKNGYHIVSLSLNGKKYTRKVHRLVAEAFIPNPKNLPEVNHKDCDKWNNDVSNLEWVSPCENTHHSMNMKTRKATLKEDDVIMICELLQLGMYDIRTISQITNVTISNILKIKCGQTWTHISSEYDFSNYQFTKGRTGNKNACWKITENQAELICGMLERRYSCTEISKALSVSRSIVYHIKCRHTWKDISKNFIF